MNFPDKERNLLWTPTMPREHRCCITTPSPKWMFSCLLWLLLLLPPLLFPTHQRMGGEQLECRVCKSRLHFGSYFLASWSPLGFLGPYLPGSLFPYHWTFIELFNEYILWARPIVGLFISVAAFNPHSYLWMNIISLILQMRSYM